MHPLAVQLDNSLGAFLYDLAVLAIVTANVYLGIRHGTLRRLLVLLGLYAGVAAATGAGRNLVDFVHGSRTDLIANSWGFIAVSAILVLTFEIVSALWGERLQNLATLAFDRVAGGIVGGLLGLMEVGVVLIVINGAAQAQPTENHSVPANHADARNVVEHSTITGLADLARPVVETLLKPVLPGDMAVHLKG